MATTIDKTPIFEAYEDVRNDHTPTKWLLLKYDGKNIVLHSSGPNYEEFKEHLTDDQRLYGFFRTNTGDELSVRTKFVLVSWCGTSVSTILRAKMGPDKPIVKKVIQNFAMEIDANNLEQLEESTVQENLRKVGGANYGTGVRPS